MNEYLSKLYNSVGKIYAFYFTLILLFHINASVNRKNRIKQSLSSFYFLKSVMFCFREKVLWRVGNTFDSEISGLGYIYVYIF